MKPVVRRVVLLGRVSRGERQQEHTRGGDPDPVPARKLERAVGNAVRLRQHHIAAQEALDILGDRKSTRLNSSHI